ncbi:MAG: AAA family ATPase [Archangium sp.]|nr:AAA family ATPase [Archangium sp.]
MFEPIETFLSRVAKEPPPSWLIPEVMPDRGKVFIVAEPNAGKTWLALMACKAAAADGREVLIVEEEGSGKRFGDRLTGLRISGKVHIAHAKAAMIDDAECRKALIRRVAKAVRPVIVFDPFASLHAGNENDTEHASSVVRHLSAVANANSESLIIVCHHSSKNQERSEIHKSRGSGVFGAWTDVQLNLAHIPTRKEEGRIAFTVRVAKSRDGHRGAESSFSIDLSTGEVSATEGDDRMSDEIDDLILGQLKAAPEGLMRSAIPRALKRKKQLVLDRVRALLDCGALVERTSANGKPVVQIAPEDVREVAS